MSSIKRQVTLINDEYLREYSLFPKNYDLKEIRNFIPVAEQIHIIPILGVALYEELLEQVATNTLTQENSTLLLEVYKVLGIAVFYESLPFVWAHISAVGLTVGKSDNSESISNKDLSYINTHVKAQLDFQKKYLNDWLEQYSSYFPLYKGDNCSCDVKQLKSRLDIYTTKKDFIELI